MTEREALYYRDLLRGVVEQVLTDDSGAIRVSEIASSVGFSRFHLTRLFYRMMGEHLEGFIRRIRLERAAYMLLNTDLSVLETAVQGGYSSGEALCRSFKNSFGVAPQEFRKDRTRAWKLDSPEGLHWNPQWRTEALMAPPTVVRARIVRRAARRLAVWRWVGNYAHLVRGWESLEAEFGEAARDEGRTYVTIYWYNMWTHPTSDSMRADLGWIMRKGEEVLSGMRVLVVPAGLYAVTEEYVVRTDRNDAWSEISGRYGETIGMDEYPAWPLPFERVLTRIVKGTEAMDRGLMGD